MTTEEEVGQSLNLDPHDGEKQREPRGNPVDRLEEEHKLTRVWEDLCSESTGGRPDAVYRVESPDETPHDKEREDRQEAMCNIKPQDEVLCHKTRGIRQEAI